MARSYSKSYYSRNYHLKHFGSRLITWILSVYYIIEEKGLPDSKEKMASFILLNLVFFIGFIISLKGGGELAYGRKKR